MCTKKIGIYKIISPSEKIYIGQSWDIQKRWNSYKYIYSIKKQTYLYNSFVKYGYDAHKFEILVEFDISITQDVLDLTEIKYINFYKLEGYNLLNLKDGGYGGKHNSETCERLSKLKKGKPLSEEHKENIRQALKGRVSPNKGKKCSDAVKKKMSELRKGQISPFKDKNHSEQTKERISKAQKGKHVSDETKEKLSKSLSGRKLSDETKDAISNSMRGRIASNRRKVLYLITGEVFDSISQVAAYFNNTPGNIYRMLQGKKNKYKIKFYDEI